MKYKGECYRAEMQKHADTSHAVGDTNGERLFATLIWQDAKWEREQTTNQERVK